MNATIVVADPQKHIQQLSNQLDMQISDRATITVSYKNKETTFCVEAQDATALRAALNAICKLLIINQKTSDL